MSEACTAAPKVDSNIEMTNGNGSFSGEAKMGTAPSSSAMVEMEILKLRTQVANLTKQRDDAVSVLERSGSLLELPLETLHELIPQESLANTYADQCLRLIEEFDAIRLTDGIKNNILRLSSIEGNSDRVIELLIRYPFAEVKSIRSDWERHFDDPETADPDVCELEDHDRDLLKMMECKWQTKLALQEPEMWDPTAAIRTLREMQGSFFEIESRWDYWESSTASEGLERSTEFLYLCHSRIVGQMLARKVTGAVLPPELVSMVEDFIVRGRTSCVHSGSGKRSHCQCCGPDMLEKTSPQDSMAALHQLLGAEMVDEPVPQGPGDALEQTMMA